MNMVVAIAAPDFRDGYRERTLAIQHSSQGELRVAAALERARGVEKVWDKTSVAARNLVLRDALGLLSPKGLVQADWSFVQTGALRAQFDEVRSHVKTQATTQAATQTLTVLGKLLDKAQAETYSRYEDFAEKQAQFNPSASGGDDEALQRYELWLRKYRPYLVLDLPLDQEQPDGETERALATRMDFFLSKNPESQFEEHYRDRLWAYVYQVRQGLWANAEGQSAEK